MIKGKGESRAIRVKREILERRAIKETRELLEKEEKLDGLAIQEIRVYKE